MTFNDLLTIASEEVDIAAATLRTQAVGRITAKGDRDYATEVDYLIEEEVRRHLEVRTPDIDFVGEEKGPSACSAERWWVLDPIDGTVNFTHGLSLCGISLALIEHDRPTVGVIDLPLLGTRYAAAEGEGATCNGERIKTSEARSLNRASIWV